MKFALNPATGLYFDGNGTNVSRAAAKALTLSEGLFRLMWPHPVTIEDTEKALPVVPATSPVLAPSVPAAPVSRAAEQLEQKAASLPAAPIVLTNKKGVTLRSPFPADMSAWAALDVKARAGKASDFEKAMESAFVAHREHNKYWSTEQRYWLHRLAADTLDAAAKPKVNVETVDLSGLRALFDAARKHLKRPAIVLGLKTGEEVKVAVAGSASKYTGQLMVTSPKFGGAYYGRVDGVTFVPGRNDVPEVRELLRKLSVDPQKTAAEHGHLTGKCCFCNRELDDERSTEVGYGPVCAEKFSLNWGSKVRQSA